MDVVTATLKQKLNLIDRMVTQQKSMRQKQEDAQNQIDKLRPLLKLVIQRTKELQTEVCIFVVSQYFSEMKFCYFLYCT